GVAGDELDDEIALERVRDAEQRVDPRRAATALEARDRRLRRPDELCELALRETHRAATLGHAIRDLREEPAAVAGGDLLPEPLDRPLGRGHRPEDSESAIRARLDRRRAPRPGRSTGAWTPKGSGSLRPSRR